MKRIADLSVFVSVVKAGSLSEASNDLGLSVASISKYISRIEQEAQASAAEIERLKMQLNRATREVTA